MSTLDNFLKDMQALVYQQPEQGRLLTEGARLLAEAIKDREILPKEFRVTSTKRKNHGTYNIYRGKDLFASASVWGPGDRTDPHNHGTWGLIGVVDNAIQETRYRVTATDGQGPVVERTHARLTGQGPVVERTHARLLKAGDVSILYPDVDEIHELDNFSQRNTVELHVYGKN